MVDILLADIPSQEAARCHVLFAGGIHDSLSAAMVATLAAPLAERGINIGVLLGTSYLFTQEAVESGAIVANFQQEALHCDHTVLVESGPGHAIRCVQTPFTEELEREKQRLLRAGKSSEEIRYELEELNIGRLRIASKGVARNSQYGLDPGVPKLLALDQSEQHRQGLYMIGQLAALQNRTFSIAELHHQVATMSSHHLAAPTRLSAAAKDLPTPQPASIAIVGMSAILPQAADVRSFWENILYKVNALTEVREDYWDWKMYFDPDRRAPDKVYSRWGGFIDDVAFDPVEFGMPPLSLFSVDPMQLVALVATREVLIDAGYHVRSFDRKRTSVILGASGGIGDLGGRYILRSGLPLLFGDGASNITEQVAQTVPISL